MRPFFIIILFVIHSFALYAQDYKALYLSDPHPAAGQRIGIIYDPSAGDLATAAGLTGTVFFYDKDKKTGEQPVSFQHSGKQWKTSVVIPERTVMLYVLPASVDGQLYDNNKRSGYLFPVWASGKPVQFAYYRMSQMAQGISVYPGKLKKDPAKELFLIKEELRYYPSGEAIIKNNYYNLLANSPELEDKRLLVQKLLTVKTDKESELTMAYYYLSYFGKKEQSDSLEQLILNKFPDGEYVKSKKKKEEHPVVQKEPKPVVTARTSTHKDFYKELKESMLNEPSGPITLKDLNGKSVSLRDSSLNGKIIIIDFWATWCKPCIASFPAMQQVMEKYSNNPDVKFFFVNTMEQGDPFLKIAAFLKQNPYPFTFLIDEKTEEMNLYKAYTHYKVSGGIPSKLVLDKKGNIRFRANGFSGDDEELISELSAMIDLCE